MEKKDKRPVYALMLIIIVGFTLYEELSLRHSLYKKHVALWIADCLPNFLAILLLAFGYMVFKRPGTDREIGRSIFFLVVGLVLYEFVQLAMPHRVFDVKDIFASILGGVFAYFTIWMIRS
ncbi:MAG: VanZ family protein [Chitinophagaceae bacterium]|nr:VanZ family protein [Chitinophagaceae bacterium]